jgi:hypothetical protein
MAITNMISQVWSARILEKLQKSLERVMNSNRNGLGMRETEIVK